MIETANNQAKSPRDHPSARPVHGSLKATEFSPNSLAKVSYNVGESCVPDFSQKVKQLLGFQWV